MTGVAAKVAIVVCALLVAPAVGAPPTMAQRAKVGYLKSAAPRLADLLTAFPALKTACPEGSHCDTSEACQAAGRKVSSACPIGAKKLTSEVMAEICDDGNP